MSAAADEHQVALDLSDVDRWVGKPVIFAELWDPCNATDIRRWVQAMDYPNPVHWDEQFARASRFGGIVAPQSFTVAMDYGHGCHPACVGKIPGSHLIFGGEEWWFYGSGVRPGDKLFQQRRFDGYKVADTKFAGPTVFSRGDTVHRNQHGVLVAKERSTAIRYLIEEARKRGMYDREQRAPKQWTAAELQEIQRIRMDWIMSNRAGVSPHFDQVNVGDKLLRRVIGPHTVVSFALECRAHRQNIWGTWRWNAPEGVHDPAREDAGFDPNMSYDFEARKIDPRMGDGLYHGPSSGHVNAEKAEKIGMGGAYGYGASMSAWFHDYVAYWAGHNGFIWHSKSQFRSPAFEGDVTYVDGEVVDKIGNSPYGMPVVIVKVHQSTQSGEVILSATAEVELPLLSKVAERMRMGQQLSIVRGIPLDDEPGLGPLSIPAYLREVVQRHAGREALVMHGPDGVVRWSYQDLWDRSVDVARALIACGVGKDSRVGILMTNRPEYLATLFGTALAGGVSVALSTFSTPSELEHLVAVSEVSILLFDACVLKRDFTSALHELEPAIRTAHAGKLSSSRFPFLQRLVQLRSVTEGASIEPTFGNAGAIESWDAFHARGAGVPAAIVDSRAACVTPSDVGGLFFSSGTTSLPKGILHAQRAFAIQWWRWPRVFSILEPARCWTGNGFFWSGNISMVVGCALSTGGAVILQPTFEAEQALSLIEAERVNALFGRPHQWARLQAAPNWSSADLASLRYITKGELIVEHPSVNTDWEVPMSFGTTETMTINTAYTADTPAEEYAGSFGEPLPGNTLKIVDPQTGVVVARGQRGEIRIKGPTLMLGYIGKAVEESLDEEGYFCTGDGGHVDEAGRLYWEGRLTDIIKTGGANVSPEEVDTAIASYPGVKRSQTVGVDHETLGEMVVACIVPIDGVTLDENALIAHLRQRLASFKIPRRVLFFDEQDFQLTGNEKVKASAIRQLAAARLCLTA